MKVTEFCRQLNRPFWWKPRRRMLGELQTVGGCLMRVWRGAKTPLEIGIETLCVIFWVYSAYV